MELEEVLTLRRLLALGLVLGVVILGWLNWRDVAERRELRDGSRAIVNKQPVNFVRRTFDPASPPPDMPPLNGGENARCDSDFGSSVHVAGQSRRTDATHATVTITQIRVDLQLHLIIWAPPDATQHMLDHEEGHRQISEYYYKNADRIIERIAANYIGRPVSISGDDLNAEYTKALQTVADEITAEYHKQIDPEPTQVLYDTITDHSRNGTLASDAVAHALKNVSIEAN
jgi:hypothetical protein